MATPFIKNGEQSHLSMMFNGEYLFLRNIKCLRGRSEQFQAASGNGKKAPNPAGQYWIQVDEVHKMKATDDWTPGGFSKPTIALVNAIKGNIAGAIPNAMMMHMSAWGEYRIPIRQSPEQQARSGRTNMFIHGGDKFGSAGCIDLTDGINILVAYLKKEHGEAAPRWMELLVT